jgi:hypothetical protein
MAPPHHEHQISGDRSNEKEDGDAGLMLGAGFREIESCSGAELNYCIFNFRKGDICMNINTIGDYQSDLKSPIFYSQGK